MKILIVTLSYFDNGVYSKFHQTQNKTWNSLNVDGVETYFLVGNNPENKINGNVIETNVSESLINCGFKTLEAFKLLKDSDFDFIFRTNSSSYVDKKLLKDYLSDKPKNNFYSGVVGNHFGILFSSGSGFIITKDLVNLVLEKEQEWEHRFIDDVALGLLLRNYNVTPTSAPRYDITTLNDKTPLNFYHYRLKCHDRNIDMQRMEKLHEMKLNIK